MTNEDGGPAFPRAGDGIGTDTQTGNPYYYQGKEQEGMSLRDYFAGQAMKTKMSVYADCDAVGIESYKQADAMLKARDLLESDNENN